MLYGVDQADDQTDPQIEQIHSFVSKNVCAVRDENATSFGNIIVGDLGLELARREGCGCHQKL